MSFEDWGDDDRVEVGEDDLPPHLLAWRIAEVEEEFEDAAFRATMFDGQPLALAVAQEILDDDVTLVEVARRRGLTETALNRLLNLEAGLVPERCCEICGVSLEGRRSDARFCSPHHRVTAFRRKSA